MADIISFSLSENMKSYMVHRNESSWYTSCMVVRGQPEILPRHAILNFKAHMTMITPHYL